MLEAPGQVQARSVCLSIWEMFWFLLGEAKCFQSRKLSAVASTESSSTTKVKQLKMTTATRSSSVMQLHPPSKNVS